MRRLAAGFGVFMVGLTMACNARADCHVSDVGKALPQPQVVFSAKNQPIDAVLQMLVPNGWVIQDAAKSKALVDVQAHQAWRDVVQAIANQGEVCITLDWDAHAAHLEARDDMPSRPATGPVNPVSVNRPQVVATTSDAVPIAPLPAGIINDVGATLNFDLRTGETLRVALTRWAAQSGWALVWQTDTDYRIQAAAQFPPGTSFKDALRQTMQAFWQQTRWLQATVYRNHVVVIQGQGSAHE